jgi:hypothetical protein
MVISHRLERFTSVICMQPDVRVVTLFGSVARGEGDEQSDLDFQIVSRRPRVFRRSNWLKSINDKVVAYAHRPASGGAEKATAILRSGGELDVVVIPWVRAELARRAVVFGLHRRLPKLGRRLADMALVIRPGYRVLVGGKPWEIFFARVVAEVKDPELSDEAVAQIAACAYADYVSIERKLARGELMAAQRWLHVHLAEANFKLTHECRVRKGLKSYHDARRAEKILSEEESRTVAISATLTNRELANAARNTMVSIREKFRQITGHSPDWTIDPE